MSLDNNVSAAEDAVNAEEGEDMLETVDCDIIGNDVHVNDPIIAKENTKDDNYEAFTLGVDFPFDQDCNEVGSQLQPINHVNKRKR
ncbi:hypothetical protein Hanom_Chr15g01400861 [Helianthus anomalus]